MATDPSDDAAAGFGARPEPMVAAAAISRSLSTGDVPANTSHERTLATESVQAVYLSGGSSDPNTRLWNHGTGHVRLNRMKRHLPIWTLLVLIASFFLFAGPAGACSCAMVEPAQMLEFGPTAFVGTVTEVVPGGGKGSAIFTFEVETVLAGEVPAVVDVTTADNSAACGFEAAIGTRMGVFATDNGIGDDGNGMLSSSLCSTTDADAAIAALGPGTPPVQGTGTPAPGSSFDWQALWLGAGGLTIVGAVWLIGRRRG